MKESWPTWEHSIPGHSPEIRVDLWNSCTRGDETVCRRQDLVESFKSHRGMTRSLSPLLLLSVATTLSPRLVPWLCCSSQKREGTNPLFLAKSLARRWCEDVLSSFLQRQLWALSLQPEIRADLWAIANAQIWHIWGSDSWKEDWNGGHCKQDVRQPLSGCHPAEC